MSQGTSAPAPAEPVLTLSGTTLKAEPGGQAQLSVRVRNPGQLVEEYVLDVVGLEPGWYQVHPPKLELYPGQDEGAIVVVSPPADVVAPEGAMPIGVRAVSTLDPGRSVVEEADLEVGRVFDLQASIRPVTSRARWRARHTLTYTNWGNAPVRLRLVAADKDDKLGFAIDPDVIAVPVGGHASARLRVRPRNPFLRGQPQNLAFQVRAESPDQARPAVAPRSAMQRAGVPDPDRPALDGAVQQLPILTRAVMMLAVLLVAAVVAAVAFVLKSGGVQGAQRADIAPDAPQGVTAQAVTPTSIRVAWQLSDRAGTYVVERVENGGGAVLDSQPVKPGVGVFDAVVKPQEIGCYQVRGVRGKETGAPSEVLCATTPDGALPAPTGVKAQPDGNGRATVSWQGDEKNQHVVLVDGSPAGEPVEAGFLQTSVVVPVGKPCISVLARRGTDSASPASKPPVCITVTAGGGGGGAQPTQQPTGQPTGQASGQPTTQPTQAGGGAAGQLTGWVAQLGVIYQEAQQAQAGQAELVAAGIPAQVAQAALFPSLGTVTPSSLVLVVPGFASQAEAQAYCARPRSVGIPGCQVALVGGP